MENYSGHFACQSGFAVLFALFGTDIPFGLLLLCLVSCFNGYFPPVCRVLLMPMPGFAVGWSADVIAPLVALETFVLIPFSC